MGVDHEGGVTEPPPDLTCPESRKCQTSPVVGDDDVGPNVAERGEGRRGRSEEIGTHARGLQTAHVHVRVAVALLPLGSDRHHIPSRRDEELYAMTGAAKASASRKSPRPAPRSRACREPRRRRRRRAHINRLASGSR